jgi:pyridoxamine 5'-phosphate oxidase-like protein
MRWDAFEAACPALAALGLERMEPNHLCFVGTLRRDGSPRISPVEPYFVDGELMIGMMWRSKKALDLLRDPRIVVHSPVSDWSGEEGDVKLYGTAEAVEDRRRRLAMFAAIDAAHEWTPEPGQPDDDPEYHMFAVDIASAGYTRFGSDAWHSWSWNPEEGLRKEVHPPDASGTREAP